MHAEGEKPSSYTDLRSFTGVYPFSHAELDSGVYQPRDPRVHARLPTAACMCDTHRHSPLTADPPPLTNGAIGKAQRRTYDEQIQLRASLCELLSREAQDTRRTKRPLWSVSPRRDTPNVFEAISRATSHTGNSSREHRITRAAEECAAPCAPAARPTYYL